jgi:hypothetical protein
MTILELPPLDDYRQGPVVLPPALPGQSLPPDEAGQGGLLQFQLRRLISGILTDPALDPDMYVSLLGHLAKNPGRPEQALLAHLRDVQSADDLSPWKTRKPGVATG